MAAVLHTEGGYNWYVDSVNGSDDNAGTLAAPFATIAKLLTVWQAEQSVGLARGSTWREKITVGSAGNVWANNAIYAYGTGNAPKIHCDDIIAAGNWTKTGGYTNIYQATISKDYSASEPCTYAAWVDNTQLTKVTSLANCDATPGSCFATNYDANSDMTFYIHSTGSSNPTSDGKTVEVAVRHSGVYGFYSTGLTVDGIETRRNFSFGGSIKVGAGATIRNCTVRQGSSHSLYAIPPVTVSDCTFVDCYNGTAGCTQLNYNKDVANGENVLVENCAFRIETANVNASPMNGHNNTSGYFGTITVNSCSFTGFASTGTMFGFNHVSQIVMNTPTFTNSYGINGPAASACNTGCLFTVTGGSWGGTTANMRGVNYSSANMVPLVMSGFTWTMDALPNTGLVFVGANNTLSITNCVFKSNLTTGTRVAVHCQTATGANLTLNNNTFNTGTGHWSNCYGWLASSNGMTWASDNNTFEATNFSMHVFGTTRTSLAAYQADANVTPRDANSTAV